MQALIDFCFSQDAAHMIPFADDIFQLLRLNTQSVLFVILKTPKIVIAFGMNSAFSKFCCLKNEIKKRLLNVPLHPNLVRDIDNFSTSTLMSFPFTSKIVAMIIIFYELIKFN